MKKTYLIILISSFAFITINTIFYFTIYNQQLEFQTSLLTRQTLLCGSGIEQDGLNFENELNYIPFADDFSRLFTDEGVRERGAENLKKLYARYSELIRKITVFDNHNNVYSIILDLKRNFVSDYYESQYQSELRNRDQLIIEDDRYLLSMPEFDKDGIVRSNIVIDLDFESYVNSIFEKYLLEGTTWPWLVSENGELLTSADKNVIIKQGDLDRVANAILEGEEGWMVHSINIDSTMSQVISVYYPLRLVKRDLAIVFSMKTDIFLRTIIVKFVIITICSLILLALLLFVHFRVVKVKSDTDYSQRISEESLRQTMDALPIGLILADPAGDIRLMNLSARELLFKDPTVAYQQHTIHDLGLEVVRDIEDGFSYHRFLGQGEIVSINRGKGNVSLFKKDWTIQVGKVDTRILLLFDISVLEKTRNLNRVAKRAKNELLKGMKEEIDVPSGQIQENITKLKALKPGSTQKDLIESIQKSQDLLCNLIKIFADFSSQDAKKVVLEEIPFSLQGEINMALDPYKAIANGFNSSIITKIRRDIPDRVIGDPFRLRKLVSGLVETSMDLTENGRILVSAEILEHSPDLVKIQFQVEDTGKGLNAEEIERLMRLPANVALDIPDELEKIVLRLVVARQHAELMNGQLWFESPSSISTDSKSPGVKFSFTIEVIPETQAKIQFTEVQQYSDINCLILSQKKDSPEAVHFKLLGDMGLNLKYLIYRPDNLDSVLELVREKSADMHMLLLIDSKEEDGFELAGKLFESGISQNLVHLLVSSRPLAENKDKSQKLGMDYYIEVPFESHRLYEIISSHFPYIPLQEVHNAPKGIKIDPNISILLAEDNLFNRKVAQALFKSIGFEIDLANNGTEVMEMLDKKKYDIIFMDLLMPGMDGLETTIAIRKLGHEMPIIALTAVDDSETRTATNKAGVNDYLVKPSTAESIREILLRTFSKSL